MYDEKRKMTIGYSGRISKVKHWLDVIFIPDEAKNAEQEKESNSISFRHFKRKENRNFY